MTHLLAVRDVRRRRAFYADLLGGRVVTEENPCIVRLARGAHFLTAPLDRGAEIRCSMRDPEGYLIEGRAGNGPGRGPARRGGSGGRRGRMH